MRATLRTLSVLAAVAALMGGTAWAAGPDKAAPEQPPAKDVKPAAKDAKPAGNTDPKPAAGAAVPADTPGEKPALCPVTNKPIDKTISVTFRGKPLYFATKEAREKFEASPEEYLDGVKAQWAALRPLRLQVKCPVTGEPIDKDVAANWKGEPVYFATEDARAKWQKDSAPYEKKLAECYTFQTSCTVCDHEIKPELFVEVDGRRIYLGCAGCTDIVKEESAKYLKKADEQAKANKAAWEKQQAARKATRS